MEDQENTTSFSQLSLEIDKDTDIPTNESELIAAEIQGTYESVKTKSSKQGSAPSSPKEVTGYSTVDKAYKSVDKGVKKPPLPPVFEQSPPLLDAQENDCQSIEGIYDSIGPNLTRSTSSTNHYSSHTYASVDISQKTSSSLPSALKAKEPVLLSNVTSYSEIAQKVEKYQSGSANTPPIS